MKKILIGILFLFVLNTIQAQVSVLDVPLVAITDVHVITMKEDAVLENQTVLIKNGKIKKYGPDDKVKVGRKYQIIKGNGGYLMPGISEMHAHIPTLQEGDDTNVRETLLLYLSNGVTIIRGMLGSPYHLKLREAVAKKEVLGPRIFTSSPSMNGNSVTSKEEAEQKVRQYKKDGYDFLKIHPGIQLDVFEVLVQTAKEVGITFSGHVPLAVGIERAIDFGYASIDHLDGYVEGLVPADAGVSPNEGGLFGFNFTEIADAKQIAPLAKKTAAANVWSVPTQSLLERWMNPKSGEELTQEAPMKYVSGKARFQWRQMKSNITSNENYTVEKAATYIKLRRDIIKTLHESDVQMLLGSDAPQVFQIPGFSIQNEMVAMAASGMSNYEILKSGTVNPARFFDMEGVFGTIEKDTSADLILLSNNPLEDIRNMEAPQGVMIQGQWLSREYLDQELAKIAARKAD